MTVLRELAPGKVNLCLFLGPTRADGLHELVSVLEPLTLADELELELEPGAAAGGADSALAGGGGPLGPDEVVCEGVEGPNLAATALAAFRAAAGWDAGPVRLTIAKRVPVAAGMGGGSSDAAATLRLAARAAGRGQGRLAGLAPELGADVPALLHGGPVLVSGAGERVAPVAPLPHHTLLVLPSALRLATADVFREADRLGLQRDAADLRRMRLEVGARLDARRLPPLVNDLEPAARRLCPSIADALAALREAGAEHAMVSGSGPTTFGLFAGDGARGAAERVPGAIAAAPA